MLPARTRYFVALYPWKSPKLVHLVTKINSFYKWFSNFLKQCVGYLVLKKIVFEKDKFLTSFRNKDWICSKAVLKLRLLVVDINFHEFTFLVFTPILFLKTHNFCPSFLNKGSICSKAVLKLRLLVIDINFYKFTFLVFTLKMFVIEKTNFFTLLLTKYSICSKAALNVRLLVISITSINLLFNFYTKHLCNLKDRIFSRSFLIKIQFVQSSLIFILIYFLKRRKEMLLFKAKHFKGKN